METINTLPEDDPDEQSPADRVLGTLAYMAPEQANGWVKNIDPKSTVFGLGGIRSQTLTDNCPAIKRNSWKSMAIEPTPDRGHSATTHRSSPAYPLGGDDILDGVR